MASSTLSCGICDLRHLYKQAIIWCLECQEGLCGDCQEHHSLSKLSRAHKTVSKDEYMKLPKNVLNIQETCDKHFEKFITFCQKHDLLCCKVCEVNGHNDCKDKVLLDSIAHNIKTSSSFAETEQLIKEILETIDQIFHDRKCNLDFFLQQKKEIELNIRQTRLKIISHLDKIEENVKRELSIIESSITAKTNELTASLLEHKDKVIEYQTTLVNLRTFATDLQTFCALKQIQSDITTQDQYLDSLVKKGHLNKTHVSFNVNSTFEESFISIQQLGDINVINTPCQMKLIRSKGRQAQIMRVVMPTKSIDTIRVSIQRNINTKLREVKGCLLLPDGVMAFSCYTKKVVRFFSKDGLELCDINTGALTYDMVYIQDKIFVTCGRDGEQYIKMIDIDSKQIKANIPVKSGNYSITARQNTLYYCAKDKGIRMANVHDHSVCDVVTRPMDLRTCIAICNDKLYYTNIDNHSITCCDLQGQTQWEFKNLNILNTPYGIDVDSNGNVYVVGSQTHNVVVISPDGKRCRQLLTVADGLNFPSVLKFDGARGQLLVANLGKTAVLFDMAS